MKIYTFECEQWLPRPPEGVYPFFADAANLERLTPSWLHFSILTPPPIEMKLGAVIDYRIRLRGIPVRWRTEITAWEPSRRFVDLQRRGPFRLWAHEHTFAPADGGTLARDVVRYALWGGALVRRLLVAPDVEMIFDYRRRALAEVFGGR